MPEQRLQQPAEDHGVGDVGDVELVEADEAPPARDARGDGGERVGLLLQPGEVLVDVAHERVEMDARLAADRHGREEAVHQEALAAADAAPEVDAARDRGRREELRERRLPRGAEGPQRERELLQPVARGNCAASSVVPRAARIGASHAASVPSSGAAEPAAMSFIDGSGGGHSGDQAGHRADATPLRG